jgi:hypothetical protein
MVPVPVPGLGCWLVIAGLAIVIGYAPQARPEQMIGAHVSLALRLGVDRAAAVRCSSFAGNRGGLAPAARSLTLPGRRHRGTRYHVAGQPQVKGIPKALRHDTARGARGARRGLRAKAAKSPGTFRRGHSGAAQAADISVQGFANSADAVVVAVYSAPSTGVDEEFHLLVGY